MQPTKHYNINEIFYSIQGEGVNCGMPAIFIRFAGCNLNCSFCDTDFTLKQEMTLEEIMEEVKSYYCENVILTGGEPTLQVDDKLLEALKEHKVHLETNGSIEINDMGYDWITVSPKEPKFKQRYGDELKILYTPGLKLDKPESYGSFKYYLIQPIDNNSYVVNLDAAISYIKKNPGWRLSTQNQKMWGIK